MDLIGGITAPVSVGTGIMLFVKAKPLFVVLKRDGGIVFVIFQ
jgi:hypothetical protein